MDFDSLGATMTGLRSSDEFGLRSSIPIAALDLTQLPLAPVRSVNSFLKTNAPPSLLSTINYLLLRLLLLPDKSTPAEPFLDTLLLLLLQSTNPYALLYPRRCHGPRRLGPFHPGLRPPRGADFRFVLQPLPRL